MAWLESRWVPFSRARCIDTPLVMNQPPLGRQAPVGESTESGGRLPWSGGSAALGPSPPRDPSRLACTPGPRHQGLNCAAGPSSLVSALLPGWSAPALRGRVSIVGRPAGVGRGTRLSRYRQDLQGCLPHGAAWPAIGPLQHLPRYPSRLGELHQAL
eukprot:2367728-Amphidinium_carterae.3